MPIMAKTTYHLARVGNIYLYLQHVKSFGDKIAIIDKVGGVWRKSSYRQLVDDIYRLTFILAGKSIKNMNIALLGGNSYEWLVTYFAIILSGNVVVPLDKELSDNEILHLIQYSESKAIFYSKPLAGLIHGNHSQLNSISTFVCFEETDHVDIKGFTSFEKFINLFKYDDSYEPEPICETETSVIVFTSGTMGKSKGAMLSSKNIFSILDAFTDNTCKHKKGVEGLAITALPLNHTYGLTTALITMKMGSQVAIVDKIANFKKTIEELKPTSLLIVPIFAESIYKGLMVKLKEQDKLNLVKRMIRLCKFFLKIGINLRGVLFKQILSQFGGNLGLIVCGGAPLAEEYTQFFCDIGIKFLNGYGTTECSPLVSTNQTTNNKSGSVGLVLSCCNVKVNSMEGESEGEIWVQGDNVMLGYYKDPLETEKVFTDGWYKTGDVGRLDKDGFLYITGRVKNMIVLRNGKNIFPEEIEEKVRLHPDINEAIVSCTKDEVITLEYYSPKGEVGDMKDFVKKINDDLPVYAQIGRIKCRDTSFPQTSTRKIKR